MKKRRAGGIAVIADGEEEISMAEYIAANHIKDWKKLTTAEKRSHIGGR